jgi:hypothetical protein
MVLPSRMTMLNGQAATDPAYEMNDGVELLPSE